MSGRASRGDRRGAFGWDEIKRLAIVIAACVALGAILGGMGGTILGLYAPSYYRSVFVNGVEAGFDPIKVGLGLGVSQGAGAGLLLALVIGTTVLRGSAPSERAPTKRWGALGLGFAGGVLLVLAALWLGSLHGPEIRGGWNGDKIELYNFASRDRVVTHLASKDATATLPMPQLLRSHRTLLVLDPKSLVWIDADGHKVPPPMGTTPFVAYSFEVDASGLN